MDLGKCGKTDQRFTFIGRVGVVTKLDNLQVVPTAWVSFNNGRTSYEFNQKHVKLETTPISMYGECCAVGFICYTIHRDSSMTVTMLALSVVSQRCGGWCDPHPDKDHHHHHPQCSRRRGSM